LQKISKGVIIVLVFILCAFSASAAGFLVFHSLASIFEYPEFDRDDG